MSRTERSDPNTAHFAVAPHSINLRVGGRFARVKPWRRMRDYVRGLLGPVGRKNGWQLAAYAGHATPDELQHFVARSRWNAGSVRDDLRQYVADNSAKTMEC